MKDESPIRKRGALPLGLIGMLALVALTERYISKRDTDLGTMYSIEWRMIGDSVKRQAPKAQIVSFGTSLTRMGVSPKVLEERLGKTFYNFALSGGQPFASYTMFRHVLAAGGRPEAVIAEFKWSAIGVDHMWNERVLPEIATLRECAELAMTARDPVYFARLALVSKLPSYRCRAEIRDNILAAIKGQEPKRNHERAIMARNTLVNKGANHSPTNGYKGTLNPDDAHLFPKAWKCDPISELYIDRFFDLAASRGIPVFWLLPPIAPPSLARREEIGAEQRYTDFVKSVAARHPEVTVVDARYSKFALEAFIDTTHLNKDGAVALSKSLGDAIAVRLNTLRPTGGLWVGLPAYKQSDDGSKIEDMGQSLASLWKEKAAARKARR
jgi:hypothetical protein